MSMETEVRGHPRHAQRAEVGLERGESGVQLEDPVAVGHGVLLHTEETAHVIAGSYVGVVGRDHLARISRNWPRWCRE